ncbi:MAG: hypothetical protein J7L39_01080, partial [Candidatus Aenigmarchaeota archaeon]|nr:hypothetical protein [Candidatus Aenigmarchaeota archaeon]
MEKNISLRKNLFLCMSFLNYEFAKIDISKFIEEEKCVLKGKRSGKVVSKKLKEVYAGSLVDRKQGIIKLKNNEKSLAFWMKLNNNQILKKLDTKDVIFPIYLKLTPRLLSFLTWAEGEFGKSPERNPQWSSSDHQEHNMIMQYFENLFGYSRSRLIGTIQINAAKYDSLKKHNGFTKIILDHVRKLEGISPDQLIPIRGTIYQSEIDTINFYYNPTLFELLISLANVITHRLSLIAEGKEPWPNWLIGTQENLRKNLAKIDVKSFAKFIGYEVIQNLSGRISLKPTQSLINNFSGVTLSKEVSIELVSPVIDVNLKILNWASLYMAEGQKNGTGFVNSDLKLVEMILDGICQIFNIDSLSPYYY